MALWLTNDDVKKFLDLNTAIEALRESYLQLIKGEAICRYRLTMRIPTANPNEVFEMGTNEGGSAASGYYAIRVQSNIVYDQEYGGVRTREWYSVRKGKFSGFVLLFSTRNGELLGVLNDGYMNQLRVAADCALGADYLARADAQVVGMLGSGGIARPTAEALCLTRTIKKIKVYSPTKAHREAYAQEMARKLSIEVIPVESSREAHQGVDILASCADAVDQDTPDGYFMNGLNGAWLERGVYYFNVAGGFGGVHPRYLDKVDVTLRFGISTQLLGSNENKTGWAYVFAVSHETPRFKDHHYLRRLNEDYLNPPAGGGGGKLRYVVSLEDLLQGKKPGRTSPDQITYALRGNIMGTQFHPLAAKVYEKAKAQGVGFELPKDMFLQDIRN